jgi:hypothetical protein
MQGGRKREERANRTECALAFPLLALFGSSHREENPSPFFAMFSMEERAE